MRDERPVTGRREGRRAAEEVGRARVIVMGGGRGVTEAESPVTAADDIHRAGQLRVEVDGALIDIEEQVAPAGGGDRARAVRALERIRLVAVADQADPEGDRRTRGDIEDHRIGGVGDAPSVGGMRAGDGARGRGGTVVIITRGERGRRDVRAREARRRDAVIRGLHLRQAVGVGVGREGRAIGDRPAPDNIVRHLRGAERHPVDVGQENLGLGGEAGAAERIDARGVIVIIPAVEVHHAARGRGAHEIVDRDDVRAAFVDIRRRVELVAAEGGGDRTEAHDRVHGAGTVDGQRTGIQIDRRRCADAHGAVDRVQAVVIPVQDTLVERDRG